MDLFSKLFSWAYTGEREWFILREAFHALFGASFAGLAWAMILWGHYPRIPTQISFTVVFGFLLILKEIQEDEVSQPRFKTFVDTSVGLVAFAVTMWMDKIL